MAGALGTVAVYGARRLQIAESAATPAAAPSEASPPPVPSLLDPHEAVVEYLKARYSAGAPTATPSWELAYMGAPVVEVEDQRLRWMLPDTRFYKTTIHGGGLAMWQVGVLVSFRRRTDGDDIRSCTPAVFDSRAHNVLSQFVGVPARAVEARREVGLVIGQLLSSPAYPGRVRVSQESFYEARVEVWRGPQHWRDIDVFEGRNGRVGLIAISNPSERTTETIISAF